MSRGVFITLEGGEGSGKSTQLATLMSRLAAEGVEARSFREPGGIAEDDIGERIRAILLDPAHTALAPMAELLLYEAARAQLVATALRPLLEAGTVVVCDRYTDSTLAYQGYGRGIDLGVVRHLNEVASGGLAPDLTLLLDVEPAEGLTRATEPGADRLESEDSAFHERVRRGFLEIAAAEPERVALIARSDPDEVADAVWRHVSGVLGRFGVL